MIFPAFPPSVARHGNANIISRVPRRSARGTNRLKAWAMSLGQVAVDDHVSPFMGDMTFIYIYIYVWQWQEHILNIVWFSSGFGFGFGPYLYYWIEPHSWKLHHWFFLTWQLKNSWRPGEIQRKMGPTKFSGTNIAMEITVSLGNDLQMVDVHGLSISIVSLLRGTRRKFDPRVEMKPTEDSNDHFRSENLQPGPHLAACSPHMQGYSQEHLVLSCSICQKWYLGTCGSFQSICFVPSPIIW